PLTLTRDRYKGRGGACAAHGRPAHLLHLPSPVTRLRAMFPRNAASVSGRCVSKRVMSLHHNIALTYGIDTNRGLRRWAWLSRTALLTAVLLSDAAVILVMSWLTGVAYHLAVYGLRGDIVSFLELGSLSAILFTVFNAFRGEYGLSNYFSFNPH